MRLSMRSWTISVITSQSCRDLKQPRRFRKYNFGSQKIRRSSDSLPECWENSDQESQQKKPKLQTVITMDKLERVSSFEKRRPVPCSILGNLWGKLPVALGVFMLAVTHVLRWLLERGAEQIWECPDLDEAVSEQWNETAEFIRSDLECELWAVSFEI